MFSGRVDFVGSQIPVLILFCVLQFGFLIEISGSTLFLIVIILVFGAFRYKPAFPPSSFISERTLFKLLIEFVKSTVSSTYLRPVTFFMSNSLKICYVYRLNRSGDKMHPCRTPLFVRKEWQLSLFHFIVAGCSLYNACIRWISCFGKPIASIAVNKLLYTIESLTEVNVDSPFISLVYSINTAFQQFLVLLYNPPDTSRVLLLL